MPLVIVEGVDGSGKSTFIQQLSQLFPDGTQNKHCGPLRQHPLNEYVMSLAGYRPHSDWILCDRWQVGEMVYGPLYRGTSKVTPAMDTYIEMFLRSRGAYRLMMNTPFSIVQRRLEERGEDFLQPQHIRLVLDYYTDYAEQHGWDSVPFGYSNRFPLAVKQSAETLAAHAQFHLSVNRTLVGNYYPDVLFVLPDEAPAITMAGFPVDFSANAAVGQAAHMLDESGRTVAFVKANSNLGDVIPGATQVVAIGAEAVLRAAVHMNDAIPYDVPKNTRYRFNMAQYASELVKEITGA